MELTNELKERLADCATVEEAKAVLADAGVELTDELLEQISGGFLPRPNQWFTNARF